MRAANTERRHRPVAGEHPDWGELLVKALNTPGVISDAYSRFWNYSVGNQFLAQFQCMQRGIELGPIHTFKGWLDVGRHVKRGEKAITLCMPVMMKKRLRSKKFDPDTARAGDGAERQLTGPDGNVSDDSTMNVTVFTYKPHWFVLSQTEGAEYVPTDLPEWSEATALYALSIERVRFDHPDGNCQGYARDRTVSVSPIAVLPHKTLFHELAHITLGHTQEGNLLDDHERTLRSLREVEAESVALICCESFKLDGARECRGYIQHWLKGDNIPERSAQKIFKAADQILKAGRATDDNSASSESA